MTVKFRQSIEKRIIQRLIKDVLASGKRISVSLERGFDIDEMLLGSTNPKAILAEVLAGDECLLFIQPPDGPTTEDGQVVSDGWVYLVFGNDGFDVISDYTTNLSELLVGTNAFAERLENNLG